jgi:septal ring factor EnvC (AmiA/AmiB activator)
MGRSFSKAGGIWRFSLFPPGLSSGFPWNGGRPEYYENTLYKGANMEAHALQIENTRLETENAAQADTIKRLKAKNLEQAKTIRRLTESLAAAEKRAKKFEIKNSEKAGTIHRLIVEKREMADEIERLEERARAAERLLTSFHAAAELKRETPNWSDKTGR